MFSLSIPLATTALTTPGALAPPPPAGGFGLAFADLLSPAERTIATAEPGDADGVRQDAATAGKDLPEDPGAADRALDWLGAVLRAEQSPSPRADTVTEAAPDPRQVIAATMPPVMPRGRETAIVAISADPATADPALPTPPMPATDIGVSSSPLPVAAAKNVAGPRSLTPAGERAVPSTAPELADRHAPPLIAASDRDIEKPRRVARDHSSPAAQQPMTGAARDDAGPVLAVATSGMRPITDAAVPVESSPKARPKTPQDTGTTPAPATPALLHATAIRAPSAPIKDMAPPASTAEGQALASEATPRAAQSSDVVAPTTRPASGTFLEAARDNARDLPQPPGATTGNRAFAARAGQAPVSESHVPIRVPELVATARPARAATAPAAVPQPAAPSADRASAPATPALAASIMPATAVHQPMPIVEQRSAPPETVSPGALSIDRTTGSTPGAPQGPSAAPTTPDAPPTRPIEVQHIVAPASRTAPPPAAVVAPTAGDTTGTGTAAAPDRKTRKDEPAAPLGATSAGAAVSPRAVVQAAGDVVRTPLDMRRDDWTHALIDRIEAHRDAADAGDTRIRLVPGALGQIDVSMRRAGDTLHVHFTADVAETRTMLAEAQPRLSELAAERGMRLGQSGVDGGGAGTGQHRHHSPAAPPPRAPAAARRADVDIHAGSGRLA